MHLGVQPNVGNGIGNRELSESIIWGMKNPWLHRHQKLLVTKRKEEVNGGEYQMRALVGTVRGDGGILSSSVSSSLELFCICWSSFFPNVMFPALCLGICTHMCSGLQNARAHWQAELQTILAPSLQTSEKGEIFDKFLWIWSKKWCTDDPSSCRWKFPNLQVKRISGSVTQN